MSKDLKDAQDKLIPVSEKELDSAYGSCNCPGCRKHPGYKLRGYWCCKKDCFFGAAGAFISSKD